MGVTKQQSKVAKKVESAKSSLQTIEPHPSHLYCTVPTIINYELSIPLSGPVVFPPYISLNAELSQLES